MKDRSAYHAAYRAARREKAVAYARKWRSENKCKERAMTAKYRADNKAAIKQRQRESYAKNREARKVLSAAYKKANRAAYRVYHLNRKRRLAGKLSPGIVNELMDRQRGRCVYCCVSLSIGYHVDHVMPAALGGTNTDDNVQLLCPPCNMSKHDKHPDVFWALISPALLRKIEPDPRHLACA